MTMLVAAGSDTQADVRWREWMARGDEADRQRSAVMGRLMTVVSIGLAIAVLIQFII